MNSELEKLVQVDVEFSRIDALEGREFLVRCAVSIAVGPRSVPSSAASTHSAHDMPPAIGCGRVSESAGEIMRPYVTQGQELAPEGVASYAPSGALRIALRNASMRWMTRWPMRPLMARQFAEAGEISLPEYDRVVAR